MEIGALMEHGGFGGAGGDVLVVDDDAEVGEAIAHTLRAHGCRVAAIDDFELALSIVAGAPPAVVVLDQIVETPESEELLARLDARGEPLSLVLIRHSHGPIATFRSLHVTVVAGERWFEELPQVVVRHTYARAY